jgi:FkbM family methyltransferase
MPALMEWRRLFSLKRYCPPEEQAYRRLLAKGWGPKAIVDVGAYRGDWTRLARQVWVATPVLMVEAQQDKRKYLERLCGEQNDLRFEMAVLAAEAGKPVDFYEMETGSSILPERSDVPRTVTTLITRTLDELTVGLPDRLFLKIDVQGAELEVLEGGQETLARSDLVQLEVPFVQYNEGAPTLMEVLGYMAERGFTPLDISGCSRPNGIDLAQVDILFVPTGSSLKRQFFNFR